MTADMTTELTAEERRTKRMFGAGLVATILGALLLVGMFLPVGAEAETQTIALHNATAESTDECPAGASGFWHFVLAPNDGSAAFVTITLNLAGSTFTFTGDQILKNGKQTDNVFVAVPSGQALTDLRTEGSSAEYTGETPNQFNLSHVCPGGGGTTTTTEGTTTTTEGTTTTTEGTTTTTEGTTTTTEGTTTTTEGTTTTTEGTTTTTEGTTTTTEGTTTTTEGTTTTTGGTTSTSQATTTSTVQTEVLGEAVTRETVLPRTGTAAVVLGVLAAILLVGGAIVMVTARRHTTPPAPPAADA